MLTIRFLYECWCIKCLIQSCTFSRGDLDGRMSQDSSLCGVRGLHLFGAPGKQFPRHSRATTYHIGAACHD